MTEQTTIGQLFARRLVLAEFLHIAGGRLDELDAKGQHKSTEYGEIDCVYDVAFDELWDVDEAMTAAPIESDKDVDAIMRAFESRWQEDDDNQRRLALRLLARVIN
jgi:hypothetical protein